MSRGAARAKVALAAALAGPVLAACAGPLEAPSAYEGQRALCGAENAGAWAARVAECQAAFLRDRSCFGHVGLRGTLQGQPIAVQASVSWAAVSEAASGVDEPYLAGFAADLTSPYFFFRLEAKQLGGSADETTAEPRTLLMRDESRGADKYVDDFAEVYLRLSVGGESQNFRALGGELSFVVPQPHALVGTFRGPFDKGGDLEGCFVVFGEPDPGELEGD